MRMWSVHPSHLDRAGLVACWRESLLAQAVLAGRTRGYRNHPQLERFRAAPIDLPEPECTGVSLTVTEGQMELERRHLEAKLAGRAPDLLPLPERLEAHPIFRVVPGDVEPWERALTP